MQKDQSRPGPVEQSLAMLVFTAGRVHEAPVKSVRHGPHAEILVSIGPDHTARITMETEALKELCTRNGLKLHDLRDEPKPDGE